MSRKPPPCRHTKREPDPYEDRLRGVVVERWRCARCKETVSMGSSREKPTRVEIDAARLVMLHETGDLKRRWMTTAEESGLADEVFSPFAGNPGWYAGSLARLIIEEAIDPNDIKLDENGDIAQSPGNDMIGKLCDIVKDAGLTMRLYGQPVSEGELRSHVESVVDAKLDRIAHARARGFVGWPADQPPQYNGSGTPCDMWIGPCSCGATHLETERTGEEVPVVGDLVGGIVSVPPRHAMSQLVAAAWDDSEAGRAGVDCQLRVAASEYLDGMGDPIPEIGDTPHDPHGESGTNLSLDDVESAPVVGDLVDSPEAFDLKSGGES